MYDFLYFIFVIIVSIAVAITITEVITITNLIAAIFTVIVGGVSTNIGPSFTGTGSYSFIEFQPNSGSFLQMGGTAITMNASATETFSSASLLLNGTISTSTASTPLTVSDAEGLRIVGVANASLSACSAGAAGSMQYDTTNNMNQICNGTAWSPTTGGAFYHARTPITGTINADNYLIGGLPKINGSGQVYTQFEIEGSWATAGTGAGTKTFAVWDVTSNASRGTCTVTCTNAALTPWACTGVLSGAVAGAAYGLKITSATTCATTQPSDVDVTVHLY